MTKLVALLMVFLLQTTAVMAEGEGQSNTPGQSVSQGEFDNADLEIEDQGED